MQTSIQPHQIYNPEKETGTPDFNQTIRFVFQYIDFAISEDEARVITSLFVEKWDSLQGQFIKEEDLRNLVFDSCRSEFMVFLSKEKVHAVVDLIIRYLRSIGQFL